MDDKAKLRAWFQGWMVTRKGGPGSGHWGHAGGTGGPGHPGGSVPRETAMSIATGRDWKERQQAAREAAKPLQTPGEFTSLEQAKRWFESKGMEADLTDITNVGAVNEAARAMQDVLAKYPWLEEKKGPLEGQYKLHHAPDKEYRFLGMGSYTGQETPPKIPQLGGDAFAVTESRSTLVRKVGGPIVYYNPKSFNTGEGSELYASIGLVAKPNATIYGATTHEMGHVVYDVIGLRGGVSKYTGEPTWAHVSDRMRTALYDAGITERMIKKNVSWYATTNEREKFAELFLILNSTQAQAPTSKAFRKRLEVYRKSFNSELGWEAL